MSRAVIKLHAHIGNGDFATGTTGDGWWWAVFVGRRVDDGLIGRVSHSAPGTGRVGRKRSVLRPLLKCPTTAGRCGEIVVFLLRSEAALGILLVPFIFVLVFVLLERGSEMMMMLLRVVPDTGRGILIVLTRVESLGWAET